MMLTEILMSLPPQLPWAYPGTGPTVSFFEVEDEEDWPVLIIIIIIIIYEMGANQGSMKF